ncbi:crossover junction endodeoxyribonuclease RuvC [Thermodesulfobacteriota bacterium]
MIKIIGIDPGLSTTGIGVVRGTGIKIDGFSYGSIQTSQNTSLPSRLDQIFSKLLHVLDNEKPDLMVVEDVFSLDKYPKAGITLGKVSGVVLLAGCRADVRVVEIPVREAKQVLTGNGNASKGQLEKAVRHELNIKSPIRPYHASDAMALAIIGLYRYKNNLIYGSGTTV